MPWSLTVAGANKLLDCGVSHHSTTAFAKNRISREGESHRTLDGHLLSKVQRNGGSANAICTRQRRARDGKSCCHCDRNFEVRGK